MLRWESAVTPRTDGMTRTISTAVPSPCSRRARAEVWREAQDPVVVGLPSRSSRKGREVKAKKMRDALSAVELEQMRSKFQEIDEDGNGTIERRELLNARAYALPGGVVPRHVRREPEHIAAGPGAGFQVTVLG